MQEGFRQSQAWLHSWAGLIISWLLYLIFVMGTLSVFRGEITYWMQPELHRIPLASQTETIAGLEKVFERFNTNNQSIAFSSITMPSPYQPTINVHSFANRKRQHTAYDAQTGQQVKLSSTVGGNFFYRMHYQLWYMSPWTGRIIISIVTAILLVTLITGIITHKKIIKDFFVFRPNKGLRSWLDGHIVASVIILPFSLMIAFSGLVILINFFMPWGTKAVYGHQQGKMHQEAFNFPNFNEQASDIKQNLPSARGIVEQFTQQYPHQRISTITLYNPNRENTKIVVTAEDANRINATAIVFNSQGHRVSQIGATNPAAAIQSTLNSLHRIHYANYPLRWLYFISSLAGCFMIASGLILWSKKRFIKHKKQKIPIQRTVQILNVACIAGLCIAIPGVLLINRLTTHITAHQALWEVNGFFVLWLLTLFYSAVRVAYKAWYELFFVASAMCLAVVIANLFYPYSHLFYAFSHNNWVLVAMDITISLLALAFFLIGYQIHASYKLVKQSV